MVLVLVLEVGVGLRLLGLRRWSRWLLGQGRLGLGRLGGLGLLGRLRGWLRVAAWWWRGRLLLLELLELLEMLELGVQG